jgi:1-acyl-sn-glycerol-3-phosphate acyltransferase
LTARPDRVNPRAVLRLFIIALLLIGILPFHGLWRLFRLRSPWPTLFLKSASHAAGLRIAVHGTPLKRDVLFIANHLSWLDILAVAGKTGSAFVAKADMAPWPVIGWMATLNNSVYVAREDRLNVGTQATAMKTALETGQPLTLFPEGTTGDGRTLLPFRSSLVASVSPPPQGISIQPVAVDYGTNAPFIAWTDNEPVGANALRVLAVPGHIPVTLHFMAPLDHADFADRKAIAAHARDAIAASLGQD